MRPGKRWCTVHLEAICIHWWIWLRLQSTRGRPSWTQVRYLWPLSVIPDNWSSHSDLPSLPETLMFYCPPPIFFVIFPRRSFLGGSLWMMNFYETHFFNSVTHFYVRTDFSLGRSWKNNIFLQYKISFKDWPLSYLFFEVTPVSPLYSTA